MGVPVHRQNKRTDNKMYRLQTPQSPLVKPNIYDDYGIDDYGLGTNAIVAVISYTVRKWINVFLISYLKYLLDSRDMIWRIQWLSTKRHMKGVSHMLILSNVRYGICICIPVYHINTFMVSCFLVIFYTLLK